MTNKVSVQLFLKKETDELTKVIQVHLKEQDKLVEIDDEVELNLKLIRVGKGKILVQFKAEPEVGLTCNRCLEKFKKKIPLDFSRIYKTQPKKVDNGDNREVPTEELEIRRGQINIQKPLHDELIVNLPVKPICSKDCQGFCQICGQNLNKGTCNCGSQPQGRKEFQKLKKLKEKKDARTKKTDK